MFKIVDYAIKSTWNQIVIILDRFHTVNKIICHFSYDTGDTKLASKTVCVYKYNE